MWHLLSIHRALPGRFSRHEVTSGKVGPMPPRAKPVAQQSLLDRLRELLADETITDEKSMFGGVCVMVRGKILVSAGKDGSLLVRVATERHDGLLTRAGASQAEMGAGRDMGPGWISISAPALEDDATLESWLDTALEHNRADADGRR